MKGERRDSRTSDFVRRHRLPPEGVRDQAVRRPGQSNRERGHPVSLQTPRGTGTAAIRGAHGERDRRDNHHRHRQRRPLRESGHRRDSRLLAREIQGEPLTELVPERLRAHHRAAIEEYSKRANGPSTGTRSNCREYTRRATRFRSPSRSANSNRTAATSSPDSSGTSPSAPSANGSSNSKTGQWTRHPSASSSRTRTVPTTR